MASLEKINEYRAIVTNDPPWIKGSPIIQQLFFDRLLTGNSFPEMFRVHPVEVPDLDLSGQLRLLAETRDMSQELRSVLLIAAECLDDAHEEWLRNQIERKDDGR